MPRKNLAISPAPFKSSFLAIPPTPFSPLLPITPASPPKEFTTRPLVDNSARLRATAAQLLPPPPNPLHWLWQCHKCARVYQLGVTRRCLDDGHFFCAGTTVVKRSKRNGYRKTVRHAACASEFDYSGWKAWGTWRRQLGEQVEAAKILEEEVGEAAVMEEGRWLSGRWSKGEPFWRKDKKPEKLRKDCWGRCDYPSECRWGKQFGVQTPQLPMPKVEEVDVTEQKAPKTTFEDILIDITDPASLEYLEPLSAASSSAEAGATAEGKAINEGETKMTSVSDLVQSARRRKSRSSNAIPLVPSPLALNPPSPPAVEEAPTLGEKKGDENALDVLANVVIDDSVLKKGVDVSVTEEKAGEFVASWQYAKERFQTEGWMV